MEALLAGVALAIAGLATGLLFLVLYAVPRLAGFAWRITGAIDGPPSPAWLAGARMVLLGAFFGYLLPEIGYKLTFWSAPGIWGAPGKASTVWPVLQILAVPCCGYAGFRFSRHLRNCAPEVSHQAYVALVVAAVVCINLLILMSLNHGMQTMG